MTTLSPDARIGAYRILGELGQGGMGTVYRAVHTLLDRPAAIKVLHPELGHHPAVVERFVNEARATTAIRHPGIVEVYDYGYTDDGRAYIAMELLVGTTLAEYIAQRRTLPARDALLIARRIAAPLAVAHERGIVHRDLKPDNVFLIADPEGGALPAVKLLDFGIAKLASTGTHTTIGVMLGTPAYMSPEQCRGTADCDHRTDLYALGCVLFELLVGWPPFGGRGASYGDLIAAHLQQPAPDARSHAPMPDAVARLVAQLLAKSPEERPASAAQVIAALDRCLEVIPHAARPPHRVNRSAMLAGFALALAGGCIGLWLRGVRDAVAAEPAPALALPADEATGEPRFAAVAAESMPARLIVVRQVSEPEPAPEVFVPVRGTEHIGTETPVPDPR